MPKTGTEGDGDTVCDEMKLSEDDCVKHKIATFCEFLKDENFCKEQFELLKAGKITVDELAKRLHEKFTPEEVQRAKREAQRRLGKA